MANRRLTSMNVHEVIRLRRAQQTAVEIARLVGCGEKTVRKYLRWAGEQGFLTGPAPSVTEVNSRLAETLPEAAGPQQASSLAAYVDEIRALRDRGMEMVAIQVRLEENHGVAVSYEAVRRAVRRMEPRSAEAFVRVEVPAGSEAQVDFGWAGLTIDPKTGATRKTWVFVMILSYSRHMYAELVYDQKIETWLTCHVHAFEFFGGVPERIVPDNLKAAIIRACSNDPTVQRSYRECAEHYQFVIDPQPPATPRMKGKVEQGGVHYVKRNFLAGREPERTDALNQKLLTWCTERAGVRRHGTTKTPPLERFQQTEQAALRSLPRTRYDLALWKEAKLYRDCHVHFLDSYYSAPCGLVGETLLVRGGARTVSIFHGHEQVAIHDRVPAGGRQTCQAHLPPEKLDGLLRSREDCRRQAAEIGPATAQMVEALLAERPVDKLRQACRLLALADRTSTARLERACARALHFGDASFGTVKNILNQGLENEPLQATAPLSAMVRAFTFVRDASEFALTRLVGVL